MIAPEVLRRKTPETINLIFECAKALLDGRIDFVVTNRAVYELAR